MTAGKQTFWTTDRIMQLIIGITLTVLLVLLLRYLSNVLLPFFVACFIAYLLQPLVEWNRRIFKLKGRGIASLLTLLEAAVALGVVLAFTLPSMLREVGMLGKILHEVSTGKIAPPHYIVSFVHLINNYVDPEYICHHLNGQDLNTLLSKGPSIVEASVGLLMDVLGWLLTLIYILFILIDYPRIANGFKLIVPYKFRPRALVVLNDVRVSMNHYFRGQGCVALCAMVFYCIGFSIVGLPLAIPMGILVGVLYMIPYFQYVTLIPVAAISLIYSLGGGVEFLPLMGKCLLVYAVSQSICDYVITPHIMRHEMGLNPAIILLSLSVWGSLLGIIGMIIALPATSLIMSYYERYISNPLPVQNSTPNPPDQPTSA